MIKNFIKKFFNENMLGHYRMILLSLPISLLLLKPLFNLNSEYNETIQYIRSQVPEILNFTTADYYSYEKLGIKNESWSHNLLLSKYDLNQDGNEEILTYDKSKANVLKIWQKDSETNEYVPLCITNIYGQEVQIGFFNEIAISKKSSKGFKDVILYHPDQSSTFLKWNGKCYQVE